MTSLIHRQMMSKVFSGLISYARTEFLLLTMLFKKIKIIINSVLFYYIRNEILNADILFNNLSKNLTLVQLYFKNIYILRRKNGWMRHEICYDQTCFCFKWLCHMHFYSKNSHFMFLFIFSHTCFYYLAKFYFLAFCLFIKPYFCCLGKL